MPDMESPSIRAKGGDSQPAGDTQPAGDSGDSGDSGGSGASGTVYYLNFKPEQDPDWQELTG